MADGMLALRAGNCLRPSAPSVKATIPNSQGAGRMITRREIFGVIRPVSKGAIGKFWAAKLLVEAPANGKLSDSFFWRANWLSSEAQRRNGLALKLPELAPLKRLCSRSHNFAAIAYETSARLAEPESAQERLRLAAISYSLAGQARYDLAGRIHEHVAGYFLKAAALYREIGDEKNAEYNVEVAKDTFRTLQGEYIRISGVYAKLAWVSLFVKKLLPKVSPYFNLERERCERTAAKYEQMAKQK
ncbi:Uncharacterised protein [Candidatus Anstonella stagnisolia]|nr:Uncharacterised protein [Candidatus Anstonella stagnisolia]